MGLELKITTHKNVTIIDLIGQMISEEDSLLLQHKVEELINAGKSQLILNLKALKLINSSGINIFIKTLTKSRIHAGDVLLAEINGTVQKVFEISKLDEVFTIYSSVEIAEKHFNS